MRRPGTTIAFLSHRRIGLKTNLCRQRQTGRGDAGVGGAREVIIVTEVEWMRRSHDLSSKGWRVEDKGRFARDLD
jgi:hypothetical protein